MKILYRFICLMIVCFPANILAQDWQCVREGVTATFIDTSTLNNNIYHTEWMVHIDSVRVYQGWNYHYGFHQIRKMPDISPYVYWNEWCFDANGPSRMGVAMSALGGENFFFNSAGVGIRISTRRQPGQPWICCGLSDTSLLYATVTSMGVETILGEPDSVKYISFQAKSNAGVLLSHPMNAQTFVLSKHHGMITLYDFYLFPDYSSGYPLFSPVHFLAGIDSAGVYKGTYNLSLKEVYMFSLGDIFHTAKGGSDPHGSPGTTETISVVIDSAWNPNHDSITYKFSRFYRDWDGQQGTKYRYIKDTVSISYSVYSDACSGFDNFSEQSGFCFDTSGTFKTVSSFVQHRSVLYNSRRVKSTEDTYQPKSICSDTLVGLINSPQYDYITSYYIDGCGGKYYYRAYIDYYYGQHVRYYSLVYFKKGTEIWGTPLDTTSWEDPYIIKDTLQDTVQVRFILYPNPSNNFITVEIPVSSFTGYRLEVYSMLGIKVNEIMLTDTKITFDISNYGAGIYFMKLFKNSLQVGQQKLVKQ